MKQGRLVTLEGGEGVGKSTQARLLADWLESQGIETIVTREPGGTEGAEAIRALLLEGTRDRWNTTTEALLVAAARSDHVARLIAPALQAGKWVVCDRFLDSTLAYQGGEGGLEDAELLTLHDIASSSLRPDITFILSLPEGEALQRAATRDAGRTDRIGGQGAVYHQRINARFARQAREDAERCHLVDASGEPAIVNDRLRQLLLPLLP